MLEEDLYYTASFSEEEVLQQEQHFCSHIFMETIESLTSASYNIHSFVLGMQDAWG